MKSKHQDRVRAALDILSNAGELHPRAWLCNNLSIAPNTLECWVTYKSWGRTPHEHSLRLMEIICRQYHLKKKQSYQLWREEDIALLTELYPVATIEHLQEKLGRSAGAIRVKANELGLKVNFEKKRELRKQA